MLRLFLDGLAMVVFFALMYFALIIGDVWENKVRCERGYYPACESLW